MLLNEAWRKTMVPTVISSAFRRSSIYPFNPEALDYGTVINPATNKQTSHQYVHLKQTDVYHTLTKDEIVPPTFTPEQKFFSCTKV